MRQPRDDLIAEIARLRDHVDELEAQLAYERDRLNVPDNIIVAGPLRMDRGDHSVELEGRALRLTGKEFTLLEMFMLKPGKLITKEAALDHLYGGMDEPEIKIIDVFVCRLRHKLPPTPRIETVWGHGWRLVA